MKKHFFASVIIGLALGLTFTALAFAEPTALPGSTTSQVPINVGADTQYRDGSLGIGDGVNAADSTKTAANSMYFESNLGLDRVVVRENALLASNVDVGGRTIVSGLLRVGQLVPSSNKTAASANGYGISHPNIKNGYDLYMTPGSTTNLVTGNYCELKSASAACPDGSVLISSDPSGAGGVYGKCRQINPVAGAGKTGNC